MLTSCLTASLPLHLNTLLSPLPLPAAPFLTLPQATLEHEQQQHASLVAGLQETVAVLQSSDDAEGHLRGQLIELAERVAVLTAAQVGPGAPHCCSWLAALPRIVCCPWQW
jgi:hypothetical protein